MAARYWVGGTADWNGIAGTKWALTDGGVGGQTVPGSSDTVFFTALSGAVTVTWFGASSQVVSINCTGFTGTLVTTGQNKTLNGTGTVWTSPATCTIIGASTLTVNSIGAIAISVTCNHASPSTTNAPSFSFTGGTYALTLTGTGFNSILTTGYSGTASGSPSVRANVTLGSTGIFTGFNPTFLASGTLTSSGRTLLRVTLNAPGGTLTLNGALTTSISSAAGFHLTAGTLNLANFTLTCGEFISNNSNTRSISFGTGNIIVSTQTSGQVNPVLDFRTATGFTWTGTGIFIFSGATQNFVAYGSTAGGSTNPIDLDMRSPSTRQYIINSSWFRNLSFSTQASTIGGASSTPTVLTNAPVNITGNLTLNSGGTYTSLLPTFRGTTSFNSLGKTLGSTTVDGAGITVTLSAALTLGVADTFTLTQGTLNLAGFTLSTGIFSSSNTNTRAITFGSGNIALTSTTSSTVVLSMADATNFTYTGTGGFTRNQAASAIVTFGPTGASAANSMNLSVTTGSSVLSFSGSSRFKNISFVAATCGTSGSVTVDGNLTLSSTSGYGSTFTLAGTCAFNPAGQSAAIVVSGAGDVTLTSAWTALSSSLTLTQGTFSTANFNVTLSTFSTAGSLVRTLNMGSSTWTIRVATWTVSSATNLVINAGTSTITMTSASAKTFTGGGMTYYNLNQGGAGTLTISDSNTFNNITNTVQPNTVTFTAGTTQTVSNFSLSGTAASKITINSSSAGTQFTLSKASGTVTAQNLRIQDSNATGGAGWYAYNSTNLGNNTGWKFNSPDMLAMFI